VSDPRLSTERLIEIFQDEIRPMIFGADKSTDDPSLALMIGQSGADQARATGLALADHSDAVTLRADDLRPFHPSYLELSRSRSERADESLAEAAAHWLQRAITHARSSRRSILLEGNLDSPQIVLPILDVFRRAGFSTHVFVAATPRPTSLLSIASQHLLRVSSRRPSVPPTLARHDAGWEGTRAIVERLENDSTGSRLTVVDHEGRPAFDSVETGTLQGSTTSLDRSRSEAMSSSTAMKWLSELRAITDYAISAGVTPSLKELLISLHELALRSIVPALTLPPDSKARPVLEDRLARQMLTLRRLGTERERSDTAAPTVEVPSQQRGLGR
jgi:UDP-N-acetylglucosamine kinase